MPSQYYQAENWGLEVPIRIVKRQTKYPDLSKHIYTLIYHWISLFIESKSIIICFASVPYRKHKLWDFVYISVIFNLHIAIFILEQPSSLKGWKIQAWICSLLDSLVYSEQNKTNPSSKAQFVHELHKRLSFLPQWSLYKSIILLLIAIVITPRESSDKAETFTVHWFLTLNNKE